MIYFIIILVLLIALVAFGVSGFNRLRRADVSAQEALGGIDVQLTRRADLIPNLVKTVQAFADQEKEVLTGVTEARARASQITVDPADPASLKAFESAQSNVGSALSRLLVTVENYPQLKSDQNFRDLQAQLEGTENRIAVARKRYIESVEQFNVLIRQIPANLTAMVFGYEPKPQFTVENEAAIQNAPSVNFDKPATQSR